MIKHVTRTMFCPICSAMSRPNKNNRFVVFGFTREEYLVEVCHCKGYDGFTPHIITYEEPCEILGGAIQVYVTCGMEHCGVRISETSKQNQYEIQFVRETTLYLPKKHYLALLGRWRNTGYEIY